MIRTQERRAKVCLVLCPGWDPTSPALGPALLKSFLASRGHEVTSVDLGPLFIKASPPEVGHALRHQGAIFFQNKLWVAGLFLQIPKTVDEAVRRILIEKPDVVGFTAYYSTWHMSVMLARRLKELDPKISVVLGGPEGMRYFNLGGNPMEGQDELDPIDAVIPGEGELSMLNLLASLKPEGAGFTPCAGAHVKVGGRFVWTGEVEPVQDLDSLPFPDFGGFDVGDYGDNRQLITYFSRGCVKKCVFCDVENYWKNWRNRSGLRVVDEIEHLVTKHPEVTNFFFGDSLVNADMKGLLQFCRLMKERTEAGRFHPITWRGYAIVRPDMTAEACRELKAGGCAELWFGIESGSQKVLDSMKKGYRVAVADAVLRNCRDAGIRTVVLLMPGFPTETAQDFEETLTLIRRNASSITRIIANAGTIIDSQTVLDKTAFSVYGVAEKSFHSMYWESRDGLSTYPERVRRFEAICFCAEENGISILRPDFRPMLAAYAEWKAGNTKVRRRRRLPART